VADRFHLLTNLREALEGVLDRAHASLRTRLARAPLSSTPVLHQLRRRRCGREGARERTKRCGWSATRCAWRATKPSVACIRRAPAS
jgi:hypothetical protein